MELKDKILNLTRQLYPTGRAFKMPVDGYLESMHKALILSEERAYNDAKSILYDILPDNDSFTIDDATAWEFRLGLITNGAVPLADRKLAIKQKLNYPGTIKARQHYLYLQSQLQAAGFTVYVHENKPEQDPLTVAGGNPALVQYVQFGDFQLGDQQLGSYFFKQKVVNSIYNSEDMFFNVGQNYRSTFFIGGSVYGSFANVDSLREIEFRQLILKIKPVQTVAFLLINYV